MDGTQHYSPREEMTNIISHAIGLGLSIVALLLMLIRASESGNSLYIVSAAIFGISLIALYAASTLYHGAKDPKVRSRLRITTTPLSISSSQVPTPRLRLSHSMAGWGGRFLGCPGVWQLPGWF